MFYFEDDQKSAINEFKLFGDEKEENYDKLHIALTKANPEPIGLIKNLFAVSEEEKKLMKKDYAKSLDFVKRVEKEFEFAGFSTDAKCKNNLSKSIDHFTKFDKVFTPVDINIRDKFHHTTLANKVLFDLDIKNVPEFYVTVYTMLYDYYIASQYQNLDVVIKCIDNKYLVAIFFLIRTRFNTGKIIDAGIVSSPNPLDAWAPFYLRSLDFDASWFGKPKE